LLPFIPPKRQRSTPVACSENSAKFVPFPSQLAPSGYGAPGKILDLVFGIVDRYAAAFDRDRE